MAKYHQYVFDAKKRAFVGKFEEMYAREGRDNYDSWFQEDLSGLKYVISTAVLGQYNFDRVLDIGCGKGAFTHLLKKKNNSVLGVDISKTAIRKARAKYPHIDFRALAAEDILSLRKKYDLVVAMEILSYLKTWPAVIEKISRMTEYLFISLYLPPDPIGFVKSFQELSETIEKHFTVIVKILDQTGSDMLILAKSTYRRKKK
ncbi:MAG: class I SAM-dependent methyltransferase [Patescibacteria group bacterium]